MKLQMPFLLFVALIAGAPAASAGVLTIPEPTEFCYPTKDDKGVESTECVITAVHGYDQRFCRPLPGFDESFVVAEFAGTYWQLLDCADGRVVEILTSEGDFDVRNEMLTYREGLLDSGATPSLSQIIDHMVARGSKFAFRDKILDKEATERFCSVQVAEETPCLSKANEFEE
jgi:hypothetical protein